MPLKIETLAPQHPEKPSFDKDVVQAYEDGKHRRYSLLFSVNGGAFALGKLVVQTPSADQLVLGNLKVWMLGLAMAVFSLTMTGDIWKFGSRMQEFDAELFHWPGKVVLLLTGGMLTIVALTVAFPFGL